MEVSYSNCVCFTRNVDFRSSKTLQSRSAFFITTFLRLSYIYHGIRNKERNSHLLISCNQLSKPIMIGIDPYKPKPYATINKLTSHLGDSGMKNKQKTWSTQGTKPGTHNNIMSK